MYRKRATITEKHSRKSVSWHKRRILARLNPKVNKSQKILIQQTVSGRHPFYDALNNQASILSLHVIDAAGKNTTYFLRRFTVREHHRIVLALRYLVAEGKIESDMTTKEWDIQLALGTAEIRKFTRKKVPVVSY